MEVFADTDVNKLFEIKEPCSLKHVQYWTSECYGFGKHIRKYAYYPKRLPLIIFTDHSGPSTIDQFDFFELNNDAPVVMFHSPALVKKWKSKYEKPCYNLYSPFVFYRRKNKIAISHEARGTLAYPAHTVPELEVVSSMELYINQLKNLPEKFHPISVSMHYHDINKGMHKLFLNQGFRVFTAGNPNDYRFTERFYSILKNFRYATSNIIGSYLFYAVEMGIPFFLYGDEPIYEKKNESFLANASFESINVRDDMLKNFQKTFSHITDEISKEQQSLAETTLGLYTGISRLKMSKVLYVTYINYLFKQKVLRSLLKKIYSKVCQLMHHKV